MGASGSSSDAQIFNCSKLKRRIENGRLGLPTPESLGPGGQICTTSCWGRRLCPDALAGLATVDRELIWYTCQEIQGAVDPRTHLVYLSRDSGCCGPPWSRGQK